MISARSSVKLPRPPLPGPPSALSSDAASMPSPAEKSQLTAPSARLTSTMSGRTSSKRCTRTDPEKSAQRSTPTLSRSARISGPSSTQAGLPISTPSTRTPSVGKSEGRMSPAIDRLRPVARSNCSPTRVPIRSVGMRNRVPTATTANTTINPISRTIQRMPALLVCPGRILARESAPEPAKSPSGRPCGGMPPMAGGQSSSVQGQGFTLLAAVW